MIRSNDRITQNYIFILKKLDDEDFKQDFINFTKLFWKSFDDKNSINDDLVFMGNGHEVDLIPDYNYEHFKDKEYSKDFFESLKKEAIERSLLITPENKTNHELIKYWKRGISITSNNEQIAAERVFEIENSIRSNLKRRGGITVAYYRINDDSRFTSDEYKCHYIAFLEGKRIVAIVCDRNKVSDIYSQIFMPHMTKKELEEWRKLQWEKDEPSEELTEEDIFQDGFDGDNDAWNQYNQ